MVNRYSSVMPISGIDHVHRRLTDVSKKDKIDKDFEEFDANNPDVWKLFIKYAQEALAKGVTKYSAAAIIHRLLWDLNVENKSRKRLFRVNHDFCAGYARKFVAEFPEHKNFFNIKKRPSEYNFER
jgi:hypothetical protein